MKVLHLVNEVKNIGNGLNNVAVDLAIAQSSEGHRVLLASAGGDYESLLQLSGVETYRINMMSKDPRSLFRVVWKLRALCAREGIEIVHCHTIAATVLARAAAATRPRLKVVATLHNEYQRGVHLMAFAHRVVGVSQAVSRNYARWWIPRQKIITIPNGILGSKRLPAVVPVVKLSHPAIVFCGGVSYRKGADVLVAAFNIIANRPDNPHLYLVGKLDWSYVRDLAASSPAPDRIHFEGLQADPRGYMSHADAFVLPSRREPMGLVLVEAMALGTPVIGSSVDGIPEVLMGGKAGILVEPENPEALAHALSTVLSSQDASEHLSSQGIAAAAKYSTESMCNQYVALYESISADVEHTRRS